MSERKKQSEFLMQLIQYEGEDSLYDLQEKIHEAEKQEKCVTTALRLVLVVGLIAISGLGYTVVFLQDFFYNPSNIFIRIFSAIGLGSAICLVAFAGCWFWYRSNVNHLYNQGRDLIVHVMASRDLDPGFLQETSLNSVSNQDTEIQSSVTSKGNLTRQMSQVSMYS